MDNLDQNEVMALASAIERGDRDGAFTALGMLIRDLPQATVVRDWIDIARLSARR